MKIIGAQPHPWDGSLVEAIDSTNPEEGLAAFHCVNCRLDFFTNRMYCHPGFCPHCLLLQERRY